MTGVNFASLPNNTAASWWNDRGMRTGMIHIFILYTAVYSLGYDGSLLNGLQALPAWQTNFDRPAGVQLGLIAATYYLSVHFSPVSSLADGSDPKFPLLSSLRGWSIDMDERFHWYFLARSFLISADVLVHRSLVHAGGCTVWRIESQSGRAHGCEGVTGNWNSIRS